MNFSSLFGRLLRAALRAAASSAYFTGFSLGDLVDSSPGLALKPSL